LLLLVVEELVLGVTQAAVVLADIAARFLVSHLVAGQQQNQN
jgi:hypothetical protein